MSELNIPRETVSGQFLADVAEIGRDPAGGWSRPGFSSVERSAHEVFVKWTRDLGCTVWTDPVGNTYAELGGDQRSDAIVVGSHLDTVPQGGTFDGAAGIAAAVEAASLLLDAGITLRRPLRLVVFAGEEGARFGAPCIGSRCVVGEFDEATLETLTDRDGRTVASCAREVGLHPERVGEAAWAPGQVAAFLELHIEQGRVLEERGISLGVVHSIAGSTRVELAFGGRSDHSGATPMWLRADALAGAAEFILEAERQASARPTSVATIGRLTVSPDSLTTVPGGATLGLDVRDLDSECQRSLVDDLLDVASRIAQRRKLNVAARLLSDQSPVLLHETVQDRLTAAAARCDVSCLVMASGASHDAAHLARLVPTGMLFVPSLDGRSHTPEEWTEPADISTGARVLAAAIEDLDGRDAI